MPMGDGRTVEASDEPAVLADTMPPDGEHFTESSTAATAPDGDGSSGPFAGGDPSDGGASSEEGGNGGADESAG